MVADNLIDMRESSVPMWMKGWRCVSCGNIVDPIIQRHRMIQQAGALRLLGTKAACRGSITRSKLQPKPVGPTISTSADPLA